MLKKPKNKQKTVADKVVETLLHPNQSGSDSESADEATAPKIIDYDDGEYELPQAGTTEFRKRNVKLLSEQSSKYKGKIASRKDFESDEEEDDEEDDEEDGEEEDYENSDSSEDDEALKAFSKALKKKQSKNDEEYKNGKENGENDLEMESEDEEDQDDDNEDGEEEEEDSDNDGDDDDEDDDSEDEEDEDTEVISKVNHEAEIQKGLCVQNQLRIWERLLELRINLQKLVSKTNQLPAAEELKQLQRSNNKYKDLQQTTTKQTCLLLKNLLTLKNTLYTQFPEVDKAMKSSLKRPLPFKDLEGEPPLKQVNQYLQEDFEQFQPYRNSVLLKWDDRTKLLQPGAGSKKKTFNEEFDIIKKINNALMNRSLLKEKSQTLKNNTQTENSEDPIRNPNIYDDSDFYHQQLRELIEYKANTTSNMSEVTKQFVELQKLRQKMKKKVDTRASKGRKLRYIVHNKLINFMAPHDNITWTPESIDELSKSLFV